MKSNLPSATKVVVIGGGVAGCSVAYHLAKYGWKDVVLLEQKFIIDNKTKIKEVLSNYSKQNNIDIKIIEYKLLILGN